MVILQEKIAAKEQALTLQELFGSSDQVKEEVHDECGGNQSQSWVSKRLPRAKIEEVNMFEEIDIPATMKPYVNKELNF